MREKFIKIMRKLPIRVRASIALIWISVFFWLPAVAALIAGVIDFFWTTKGQFKEGYSVYFDATQGACYCIKTGKEL
ncbi:hypothetical protein vFB297_0340 [Pseudomonas phage vFB297]|nr:hypothetical protein vFB297_0340 [Pseudomonas phage vFB297]